MKLSALLLTLTLFPEAVEGMGASILRRRAQQLEPTEIQPNCGDFNYELFIGVEAGHMGIFADPTTDVPVPDECGPVFFHLSNPANKVVESSNPHMFPSTGLHPLGNFKMTDILAAFDSVPVAEEGYDIVNHHCALLVLQMMCYLEIPVAQEMKDWTAGELMRTEASRDRLVGLMHNSSSFVDLGIPDGATGAESIRRLVEYDANQFTCAATDVRGQEETSGSIMTKGYIASALAIGAAVVGT